jgi:hypothetical protein
LENPQDRRDAAIREWKAELDTRRTVVHVCVGCGEKMVVHQHSSWQAIKTCDAGRRALCDQCASWPECPLPEAGTRGQGNHNGQAQ